MRIARATEALLVLPFSSPLDPAISSVTSRLRQGRNTAPPSRDEAGRRSTFSIRFQLSIHILVLAV